MINVQIVDDHKLLVEVLRRIVDESGVMATTGVYYDIASCRCGLQVALPDVLLLDIQLPDGSGIDYCTELKKKYPALKIIMLTGFNEFSVVKRSLCNGAMGYILKNSSSEEVIAGIETVYEGNTFFCETIDLIMQKNRKTEVVFLTSRETEILNLIAWGFTNPEIAEKLFISPLTVKGHRRTLLLKLSARNTAELIKKANEQKLVNINEIV
jgi:DNA-binding NarL/FixJ family response regulator